MSESGTCTEQSLTAARRALCAAVACGDARALSRLYSERGQLLTPAADPIRGRPAIKAFWQAGVAAGVSALRVEPLDVVCREGVAYEVGRYEMHLTDDDGRAIVDRGKYVAVLERQPDGDWHRALEMFNPD